MSNTLIKVTVNGPAGLGFQIIPRDRGDEPPPPVVDAALKQDGSAQVYIPSGYYVVVAAGVSTQVIQPGEGVAEYVVKLE